MAGEHVISVTDGDFEEKVLKSDKLVLVDFWATWCGPCLALSPTLEALASENAGKVVIAKLNVDENRQIASQHKITSIPTVLAFKDGKLVDGLVGSRAKGQYQSMVEKHL